MIGLTILTIIIAGIGLWLQKMDFDNRFAENLISDTTGLEEPTRLNNKTELYILSLHNYGSVEEDLEITINFYLDVEILNVFNIEEEGRKINQEIRTDKSEYYVEYSKIYANEDIIIRLDITSDEIKQKESLLVYPYSINAYTNSGKINIYRSFETKFFTFGN